MKNIIISANKIKLIEGALDFLTTGTWKDRVKVYFEQYDNNCLITEKSVIAIKHCSGDLLAIDGSKLCFAGRLVCKNVKCIILEKECDKKSLDNKIYNSQMIWKKTIYEIACSEYCDFFNNSNAAWRYDIPRHYTEELKLFDIEFKVEQMMFHSNAL